MMRKQKLVQTIMVLLVVLALAGCGGEPAATATARPEATATARPTATGITSPLATPVSPLPTPPATAPAAPSPSPSPPPPLGAAGPSAAAGGLTTYLGVNQVLDLAFEPGTGALWAATTGGVARWDLETDRYVQYRAEDAPAGPASNYVTGVAVAPGGGRAGGVWFATGAGASHFDGDTWTSYPIQEMQVAGTPQSVAVTCEGEVWVGTTDGAARYDPAAGTWTGYLARSRAWDVAVALAPGGGCQGSIWFAGHGAGVHRYDPATDAWATYNQAAGDGAAGDGAAGDRPLQGITTVVAAPDGSVWAYENWDGVYRFDGERVEKVMAQGNRVCDIAFQTGANDPAAEGTPWLATCGSLRSSYGGLFRGTEDGWAEVEGWHPLGRPAIEALAFSPAEDTLALATGLGIAVRTGDGAWRLLRGGPSRNWVTAAAVARSGGVWFGFGTDSAGFGGGGASRFEPGSGTPGNGPPGNGTWTYALGDLNVRVLAVAPDGALWAGTGCSVQRLGTSPGGDDWQTVAECGELGSGNVLDFAFGPDGEVWAATGMNLARWHEGAWQVFDRLVHSVAVAADGTVWASGWQGAEGSSYVARYDGATWTPTHDRSLSSLTVMPDGRVWGVDGELGLVRWDGEAWQPVPGPGGEPVSGPLAVGPDGALWAAGPVPARYDGEEWTVPPSASSAPANAALADVEGIQALAVAEDGTLWLTTSAGIIQLRPND